MLGAVTSPAVIKFLSTLSLRRATVTGSESQKLILHFYPRSPCGERLDTAIRVFRKTRISIHALLAESDIRSPQACARKRDFYPRSPCGERLPARQCYTDTTSISIHALLAESDHGRHRFFCGALQFLSTLSLRRATRRYIFRFSAADISIHALLAESDAMEHTRILKCADFYPRSPCGERLSPRPLWARHQVFLSTLSLRRATNPSYAALDGASISIHALLAESDRTPSAARATFIKFLSTLSLRRATNSRGQQAQRWANFYPRSPCGERPSIPGFSQRFVRISIHALLAESDRRGH